MSSAEAAVIVPAESDAKKMEKPTVPVPPLFTRLALPIVIRTESTTELPKPGGSCSRENVETLGDDAGGTTYGIVSAPVPAMRLWMLTAQTPFPSRAPG